VVTENRVLLPDGVHWHQWEHRALLDNCDRIIEYQSTGRDITEQRLAEQALLASEERYRTVVEDQTELIERFRPDGSFIFVNEVYCRFYHTTAEEVIGRRWQPHVVVEDLPFVVEQLKFMTSDNPVVVIENRVISGCGEVRWMQFVNRGFFNSQGELVETQVVGRDITERKRAEELLRTSAEEINDLYNNAPCGYHSLDADGFFVRINDTELNWLGYERDEIIGVMNFADMITPESKEIFNLNFPKFMKLGLVSDLEFEMVRKDGSCFPVIISATAIKDADDRFVMSRSMVFNNTDRNKAEQALKNSEDQFHQMAEIVAEVFWLMSPDSDCPLYVSPGFQQIWGHTCAELFAHPQLCQEATLPEDLPELRRYHEDLARGNASEAEYRIRRSDGLVRWISDRGYPQRDSTGEVTMIAGVSSDITKRKQAEESLKRYAQRLISMDEELRKEIAIQLHDEVGQEITAIALNLVHIRNNLTAVPGEELLPAVEESRMLAKSINRTVRNLMVSLRPTQLDDYGLASAVKFYAELFAKRTRIAATVNASPDFPRLATNTEIALFRIIQEALNNTAKYADASKVSVDLNKRGTSIHISITDDGKGFDPQDTRCQPAGSGWGLTIMRERAELAGGEFSLNSTPGEGTSITVIIRGEC